jgi:hypothetical protein
MVKVVLDTQQIPALEGLSPGTLLRLTLRCVVEACESPEDGYSLVTLDVRGADVEYISEFGDPVSDYHREVRSEGI